MTDSSTLRARYRAFRKKLLSFAPFVRRRRHKKAIARLEHEIERERSQKKKLGYLLLDPPPFAHTARFTIRVPIVNEAADELCLFVTHAACAAIKSHVIDHVEALLDAGIRVLLVANTDLDPSSLQIPTAWAPRLQGCIVRENIGYDFGAWAHAYSLIDSRSLRRLYLINDSIVGPLDCGVYQLLLQRIRESSADLVGLTWNTDPHEHLQSYYLAFNERLLRAPVFGELMRRVVNMPHKQNVIDCYEIWLTEFLRRNGFSAAAMFPKLSYEQWKHNDTIWCWKQLVELGFPFVKSEVLARSDLLDEASQLVPSRYFAGEARSSQ